MSQSYTASDIEVLSGLEPVRRRPGMYTHTSRPNHLAHEVIDNSVDEALAGYCDKIDVIVFKDGSLQVEDNGRGMPEGPPKRVGVGTENCRARLLQLYGNAARFDLEKGSQGGVRAVVEFPA